MQFSKNTEELVLATSSEQLTRQVDDFKRQYGIDKLIACCGGAAGAGLAQEAVLADLFARIRPFAPRVAILTGGTLGGIPELATLLAYQHGLEVLAVVPACAKSKNLLKQVACRIRVEALVANSTWGSEAAVLMNMADAVVLLGGGAGTLIEFGNTLKINEGRLRAQTATSPSSDQVRLPIIIAPITGHGGVADLLPEMLQSNIISRSVWESCFPADVLHDGAQAASYLVQALALVLPPD